MISRTIQSALEREIVGQTRAVQTLVRTVTIAIGGMDDHAGPAGLHLFVGPSGTGKSHMARALTRFLHGPDGEPAVVDCTQMQRGEEWSALERQVAHRTLGPVSVLLIEHLERATPEFVEQLVTALETGHLMFPGGKSGNLRGCLVLMTSNLCAREIYEAGRQEMGFKSAVEDLEEGEKARIYQLCVSAAQKRWGGDFLGHLDDLIVFHRLRKRHLPFILRRFVHELNHELVARRIVFEAGPCVAEYLVERASPFLKQGAWVLAKVFRRFVRFPLSDLLGSQKVQPGSRIRVEMDHGNRLHFIVESGAAYPPHPGLAAEFHPSARVPVHWVEDGSR